MDCCSPLQLFGYPRRGIPAPLWGGGKAAEVYRTPYILPKIAVNLKPGMD
jgi:hypothetical protein